MHSSPTPVLINPSLTLARQLNLLRLAKAKGVGELADATGLSRLTVSAAESKTDARISTLSALFDALGYTLVAVPKPLVREVANFVNNGGVTVSRPAGETAPMGRGQRVFQQTRSQNAFSMELDEQGEAMSTSMRGVNPRKASA